MNEHTILITGGAGCLGSYIISHLLSTFPNSSIHSLDIASNGWSKHPRATYHTGDVLSASAVSSLLSAINPSVIIHTASPPAHGTKALERNTFRVNVEGTKNLLDCALANRFVQAFVYTSSISAMEGTSFHNATELQPLRNTRSRGPLYAKSKALAERMVRDYNGLRRGFRTVALRMVHLYGVGEKQFTGNVLNKLKTGEQKYQIGKNDCLYDAISAPNAARAHILAAEALVAGREGVDGEAFLITDGRPTTFWDLQKMVLMEAGDRTTPDEIWIIPAWAALASATLTEWLYWLFTVGTAEPQVWRRWILSLCCLPLTFDIRKARDVLGFEPVDDRAEVIRDMVAWAYREKIA